MNEISLGNSSSDEGRVVFELSDKVTIYRIGNITEHRIKMHTTCRSNCFQSGRLRPLVWRDVFMFRKRTIGFLLFEAMEFEIILGLRVALRCAGNTIRDHEYDQRYDENDHGKSRSHAKPAEVAHEVISKGYKQFGGAGWAASSHEEHKTEQIER